MTPTIINLAAFTLVLFPLLKLIAKYFGIYTNYMLDIPFKWNSSIEKTRLFLYSFIIPALIFLRSELLKSLNYEGTYSLFLQILLISSFVLLVGLLYLTWTPLLKNSIRNNLRKIVLSQKGFLYRTIFNNKTEIYNVYQTLNKKFFFCSYESFLTFLSQSPLQDNPKIKWVDIGNKNNTDANQQSLIVFICKVFPYCSPNFIQTTIEEYFCSEQSNAIKVSKPAISTGRKNFNNLDESSKNIQDLIYQIDKNIKLKK